jgi:hypothetical protein
MLLWSLSCYNQQKLPPWSSAISTFSDSTYNKWCVHEHLPSPRSRILRTINDVSTAHQLSSKCWLHSWKIAGCNHCCTWNNRMLARSRKEEDQQVLVIEHVESSFVNYKCSIYGKMGHNMRSCVNLCSLWSYFDRLNNDTIIKTGVCIELVELSIPSSNLCRECIERKYFTLNPLGVCTYPKGVCKIRCPKNK